MISEYKPIEEIILNDHNETRAVFNKYNNSPDKDEKLKWYRELVYLIAKHAIAEEIILYPLLRDNVHNGEAMADQDLKQHRLVKEQIVYIQDKVKWDDPEFDVHVKAMWVDLCKHMNKEECEVLKELPLQVLLQDRIDAGRKFENNKMIAPSRVHLNIPDECPTMEIIIGLMLAPIDKFRDLFSKFPEKSEIEQVKQEQILDCD
jgi:hypothetical protein